MHLYVFFFVVVVVVVVVGGVSDRFDCSPLLERV